MADGIQTIDPQLSDFFSDRFVEYPQARSILNEMNFVFELSKVKKRPHNLMITGPSNSGKSSIIKEFVSRNSKLAQSARGPDYYPTIAVLDMPPTATQSRLLDAIAYSRGFGFAKGASIARFIEMLELTQTKLIIIDEFHHLDTSNRVQRLETLNAIKWIGNTTGIPFIVTGTSQITSILTLDEQFQKRYRLYKMPSWKQGGGFQKFVYSYLCSLPIEVPHTLPRNLFTALLQGNGVTTGDVVEALSVGAYNAFINADCENLVKYIEEACDRTCYVE